MTTRRGSVGAMQCIATPLSDIDVRLLKAYAEHDVDALRSFDGQLAFVRLGVLTERGFVKRTKRGVLVTPEGLAALTDAVPAQFMRTASQSAVPSPATQDAPTHRSAARRTSAAPSSRRRRAAS